MAFRSKQLRRAAQRLLTTTLKTSQPAPAEVTFFLGTVAGELQARFPWCDRRAADEAALAAWSEQEGKRTRCYADLDASTPHLIFLVDPVANTRRPIPVVDLVRLLGPRAAAA